MIFKLCCCCGGVNRECKWAGAGVGAGAGTGAACCLAGLAGLLGGGLASFAGLDRVDDEEEPEDDDKLETPEDSEAAF